MQNLRNITLHLMASDGNDRRRAALEVTDSLARPRRRAPAAPAASDACTRVAAASARARCAGRLDGPSPQIMSVAKERACGGKRQKLLAEVRARASMDAYHEECDSVRNIAQSGNLRS